MSREIVRTKGLSLFYEEQEHPVLSSLDFTVDQGDGVLLLGPSGSGKSSLTHCLNGLYPRELDGHLEGEVYIDGTNTADYPAGALSRKVGVVFQDPETQFCMLTVEDEIAFGLENLNTPLGAMKEKVDQALAWVGMEDYKTAHLSDLSGGQKQKIALACILAMEPDIVILDEPTANLDPIARTHFIRLMKTLKKELAFTLLVIEHKLEGWLDGLERLLIIDKTGSLAYDGPTFDYLRTSAPEVHKMGIQLPYATRIALKHSWSAPYPLRVEELPAGPEDFAVPYDEKNQNVPLKAEGVQWKTILKNIDLSVKEGEWIALLGKNGSGKSSLSKILAGIQRPDDGTLTLHNQPLKKWREKDMRKEIGYVFQNPEHQFITDTVYDEVAFSLKHSGMAEERWKGIVRDTLTFCRLEAFADQHPFLLSQGQKRRLSVATMIVEDQQLLILDEPTFGQDEQSTAELMTLLKEKHRNGTTIVMITHDMELVEEYATRTVVMDAGQIAFDGRPDDLWQTENLADFHLELPPGEQWKRIDKARKERAYVSS